MGTDVRWTQRYEHLRRAFSLLEEPIERGVETLSMLERGGTVRRFEVALERAWTTMKDLLEQEAVVLSAFSPKSVVKESFAAGILASGHPWMDMLDHRNLLAHTYDEAVFEEAVRAIPDRYLAEFRALVSFLAAKEGAR